MSNPSESTGVHTLVIGIDACSPPMLGELFEAGVVPNIESIFHNSVTSSLESQIPPWTASAWPSLYTGTNPGKHGIFDFLTYDGYDWGVVNATDVMEHAIWELLDYHDRSSVVVNVPMTHPPPAIDGAIVPGFTAPEEPDCHPPGILDEIRERTGEYRVYPTPGDDEATIAEYLECIGMRGETFRYLIDRINPDLGFIQFQSTDTVFHQYQYDGDDRHIIEDVYRAVDAEIGAILETVEPRAIFVVSDHGIGEYTGYEFRINDFLRDHGYLQSKRGGPGMPSWHVIRDSALRKGEDARSHDPGLIEKAVAIAAKGGVTTSQVGRILDTIGLHKVAKRFAPAGVVKASAEQVDFPNSKAYMRSRVETGIRLNVAGREPNGIVLPEEYEALREELIKLVSSVRSPAGEPVFDTVARREQFFRGDYAHRAVDIVTIPRDWNHFLSAQLQGNMFGSPAEPWNHKLEGVFAATGPTIDSDVSLLNPHLLDVAPTIISSLGVPISDRMDGIPLPVVEPTEEMRYPKYAGQPERADSEEVESRLEALGYVE